MFLRLFRTLMPGDGKFIDPFRERSERIAGETDTLRRACPSRPTAGGHDPGRFVILKEICGLRGEIVDGIVIEQA